MVLSLHIQKNINLVGKYLKYLQNLTDLNILNPMGQISLQNYLEIEESISYLTKLRKLNLNFLENGMAY